MDRKTCSEHFDMEKAKKAVQNLKRVLFMAAVSGLVSLEPACDFVI
jgi:predicted nucleic acid-binding Zn ribbon protein